MQESNILEQILRLFFPGRILKIQNAYLNRLLPEQDLNFISNLHVDRCLRRLTVDHDTAGIAGFVGYCTAFDQAGHLQKFV